MRNQLGPRSNRFISQRLQLHYVDWGNQDAPLLILQHGARDHCRSWDWAAEELCQDWHVVCPDLRGHGDSQWSPEGYYGMDAFVYDFTQLVHTLGRDQVTILAHSLGGNISTRFAGLYPEKVAKLINIEGLGAPPSKRLEQDDRGACPNLRDWVAQKRASSARKVRRYPSVREAYQRMKEENSFLSDDQALHLTIHGASRNEDGSWSWKFDNYLNVWPAFDLPMSQLKEIWQAVTCPVLFLWGKDSFASSPAQDERLAYFRNARLIEYDDAGHWVHHDQFERFIHDTKSFLSGVD